jgi:hypothetical protein
MPWVAEFFVKIIPKGIIPKGIIPKGIIFVPA